jgi:hypothetical protein
MPTTPTLTRGHPAEDAQTSGGLIEAMNQKSPVCYRDSQTEQAVVAILTNMNAREAFLSDREAYLARFNLSSGARNALLEISDEQIITTSYEYYHCYYNKPSQPCGSVTWGIFCDS